MKRKLRLALFLLFMVGAAKAQVKKGDLLLGGTVGLLKSNGDNVQTNISVAPSIGKAIQDNLVVGVNLSYGLYKTGVGQGYYLNKTDVYGASFFVRRYKPLGPASRFSSKGDLGYSYQKQREEHPSGSPSALTKTDNVSASFVPGISYTLTKHVQLETSFPNFVYLSYNHNSSEAYDTGTPGVVTGTGHSNGFNFSTNLSQPLSNFQIGVRFII